MSLFVETTVAAGDWPPTVDWDKIATRACLAAICHTPYAKLAGALETKIEIAVRLTDDTEIRRLNAQFRGKDRPTNVLSFPMVQSDLLDSLSNSDDGEVLLGDIVLAAETITFEATDKALSPADHATHLIVHGMLHLLGYDHERDDAEAEAMEAIERIALTELGLPDPYAER